MEDNEMLADAMKGWHDCNTKGSKGLVLFNKVKAAKLHLKRWVKVKKSGQSSIPNTEKHIGEVESKAMTEGWTIMLRNERLRLISALWKQIRLEEHQWRHKSRVLWLKDGDRNLKFFHTMYQVKRQKNQIGDLLIDGEPCTDPITIKDMIYRYFKKQFQQESWRRP
ncbi:hypothetical protein Dsin_006933 [Dipteronia sinensis]|uniref:Uncharacterized protein n=1 Tax=Dipteronia sinensis TaxID=43782 RepID=A0AAE0AZJ4_9ROSI|nr:hypothetical protein Dsin_006933 [Dipteronia sinensis]